MVGFICALGLLTACSSDSKEPVAESEQPTEDILALNWEQITEQAKGQQVNIYMYGGSDTTNRYLDEWIKPRLQEEYEVDLRRVPVSDIEETINQLLVEKKAGKETGSIDLLWLNGENFRTAKSNDLLWGPITEKLPNFNEYVDGEAADIQFDFGIETDGLEAPWGKAQFVFVYDQDKVAEPPQTMEELKQWVEENPGKFTYPSPPDFTGSAFIRHVLYETTGGHEQYMKPFSEEVVGNWQPMWDYLNEIKPFLWREGKTYPENSAKLDQLYSNGEVWMTMGYDPAKASNEMMKGTFQDSTRTFVLKNGTLANTHFLAIPYNSGKQAGAMVAINFLLSPEAQITKFDPQYWGEGMVLDMDKLSDEQRQQIEAIDRGVATLSNEVLSDHQVPEIPAEYVEALEKQWHEHVAKP
ncbi:ABC transporter substrate-binding protein [Ammoniphilus oxalaticus]|uniref:ABC transporter substrate-binding protein n=2 Tax=Ammoniphilus oxalaticus TaxID=66863 RepID=A0A419SEY4_9BACL|nr:ABC transporter substrate-binding protein [Ammoniphilus oxalaticus]